MRLLYVLPEFPPDFGGGIATVYGQLLPRLADLGHDITVLLASPNQLDQPSYVWRGVEVQPLQRHHLDQGERDMRAWRHHAFLHHFLPLAWAAWNKAQSLAPFDVVETTDWALLFLPWLVQRRKQPVVVSLHGSCGQVDWHGNPHGRRGEGQLVRLLEMAALPLADWLIANSTLNAEFWCHQCGVRPQVIPPLVEGLDGGEPGAAAAQPLRQVPRSDRGVVVARLQNWKGPEVLCKALRLLPGQQIDWIGQDTPWEATSIKTSEHLRRQFPDVVDEKLHLLGRLPPDQVQARIRQAAFVCIPSLWDVFNVTGLDAIVAGTPLICSSTAGVSRLIQDNLGAYTFDSRIPASLAFSIQAVMRLTPGRLQQLAMDARSVALMACDPASVLTQYIDCYRTLTARGQKDISSEWLRSSLFGAVNLEGPLPPNMPRLSGLSRCIARILRLTPFIAASFFLCLSCSRSCFA